MLPPEVKQSFSFLQWEHNDSKGCPEFVREVVKGLALCSVQAFELLPGVFQGIDSGLLKLGDLDKNRDVISKGLDKSLIFFGEGPILLVKELDGPHSQSSPVVKRYAKQSSGLVARMGIDIPVESWVFIGILKIDGLSGLETSSCQATPGGNSNDLPAHPKGHCGPEFIRIWLMKKYTASICLHDLARLLGDL